MDTKNNYRKSSNVADRYSVAIDIGSTKVIILVGEKSGEGHVRIVAGATAPLREGCVRRGTIENLKDVTTAIKECIATIEKEDNMIISEATIGVTGQHVYCKSHTESKYVDNPEEITEQDIATLKENVWRSNSDTNYFIMDVLPINYTVDLRGAEEYPVGKSGNKIVGNYNVLYGDYSKNQIIRKAVSSAGIIETALMPFAVAAAESVLTDDDKSLGVALVDIGSTSIEIVIYTGGVMRFMVTLPYGSSLINNDIRAYGVVPRAVESLKVQFGCAVTEAVEKNLVIDIPTNTASESKPLPARTLSRIIEARLTEIGKGIKEMIALSGYSNKINNGIVLTGGGAKLRCIDKQFSRITNLGVRLGIPDNKVDGIDNDTIYDKSYATAIGILLTSLQNENYSTVEVIEPEIEEVEEIEEVVETQEVASSEDVAEDISETTNDDNLTNEENNSEEEESQEEEEEEEIKEEIINVTAEQKKGKKNMKKFFSKILNAIMEDK